MKIKFDGTNDSFDTGIAIRKGRKPWKITLKQRIKMFRIVSVALNKPQKYWSDKKIAEHIKINMQKKELLFGGAVGNVTLKDVYASKAKISDKNREAIEKRLIKKYCK